MVWLLEIGIWKFIGYWKLEFGNWKKQKVFACKSGSLLLMSILILSSIITAASTMGTITLQNLRLGIAVDNGLVALYAAESGVEDALYEIRKNETAAAALLANGTLANNASWARTITTTTMSLGKTVPINGSWEINLYEPDTSLSPLSNPIKSLRLSWAGSGSEWAEVKITPWTTAGSLGAPTTQLFSAASNPDYLAFHWHVPAGQTGGAGHYGSPRAAFGCVWICAVHGGGFDKTLNSVISSPYFNKNTKHRVCINQDY